MKKTIGKSLLFYILLFCACQHDFLHDRIDVNTSLKTNDARSYFETFAEELAPLSFTPRQFLTRNTSISETVLTPEWHLAIEDKNRHAELVEVPLATNTTAVAFLETLTEHKLVFNSTMPVVRKLVIAKRRNGPTQMFVATLIPDDNYLQTFEKDPYAFRYLGGSTFTGLVFCSTLNGQYIEGYRYENGKQTAPLHVHQCNQSSMDARSEYHGKSIRMQLSETTQDASTYSFGESGGDIGIDIGIGGGSSSGGNGGNTTACSYCQDEGVYGGCPQCGLGGNGEIGEVIITYCSGCLNSQNECKCCPICKAYPCKCCPRCWNYPCNCPIPPDPDMCEICLRNPCECHRCEYCKRLLCYGTCLSSGGGNQDGNTGKTDPLKYIEKVIDLFAMEDIPRTMPTQIPNGCVLACMEYINHLWGGEINQGVYLKHYWRTYKTPPIINGISSNNMLEFVNTFFYTEYNLGFQESISKGWVILTDITSNIPNSSHAVVVVGYGPNGTLIYMDPEKGYLCENDASQFNISTCITITNTKNEQIP